MPEIDFKQLEKITPHMLGEWVKSRWISLYRIFWSVLFATTIAFGAYTWSLNLYQFEWSESEKNNFLNSQPKEDSLKREMLKRVIQRIESDREKFNQEVFPAKNIFKSY